MRLLTISSLFIAAIGCLQATSLGGQVLTLGPEVLTFGRLDGTADQVIGEISDIAVAADGSLAILDGQVQRVALVSAEGELAGWFGTEGDGPEEFRFANAVEVRGNQVIVSDPGHQRLVVLDRTPSGFEFVGDIRIDLIALDFCLLGNRIFALGLKDGQAIHEFSSTGERVQSFGAVPEIRADVSSERWRAQVDRYFVRGTLVCAPESGSLIIVPRILPEVTAFSSEGELRWVHRLSPWKETTFTETRDGRFRVGVRSEDGGYHVSESAFVVRDEVLAIQVTEGRLDGTTGTDHRDAVTRFLDLGSGTAVSTQAGIPRSSSIMGRRLVAWHPLPFPRVVVMPVEF